MTITERLEKLRDLKPGWLDGKGDAYPPEQIDWLESEWKKHIPEDSPVPYFFPWMDGTVGVEWDCLGWYSSLEIDLATKATYYHAIHIKRDESTDAEIDLSTPEGWAFVARALLAPVSSE